MKILTAELEPTKGSITAPRKWAWLRQDQFAFDESRVIDTVVMGNKVLWDAPARTRDALYTPRPHEQLTDADGLRLGELEGIVGEEGGTLRSDAGICSIGLGIEAPAGGKMGRAARRPESARAARASPLAIPAR